MLSKLLASWSEHSPEAIRRRLRQAQLDAAYHMTEYTRACDRRDQAAYELRVATRPVLTTTRKEAV